MDTATTAAITLTHDISSFGTFGEISFGEFERL